MKQQKLFLLSFFLMASFLITSNFIYSQTREVIIEPGEVNAIKNAMEADLAATDSATVSNTKYILRRDATYAHDDQYQPTHAVWLEAEEGDGARPRIIGVHPASGEADRLMRPKNNLRFVGIYYGGFDSAGEHTDNAPIRVQGDNLRIYVEDCVFDNHRLEIVRMDGSNQTLIFKNNIVRNNFQQNLWNKGWGLDRKNLAQDTLIMENNTWFNSTSHIFSHRNEANIKYMRVSENTFVNIGGLFEDSNMDDGFDRAVLSFGPAQTAICVNNLLINSGFMGIRDAWADIEFMFDVTITDSTEQVTFLNNNLYLDPELPALFPDSVKTLKLFNPALEQLLGDESALGFTSDPVTFVNAPGIDSLKNVIEAYYVDPGTAILDPISLDETISNSDVDFKYSDSPALTGNTNGQPLGAWRWFPDVDFLPVVYDQLTDVEEDEFADALPSDYELFNNYPNPFNPSTTIKFAIPEMTNVKLTVYNSVGQEVTTIVNETLGSGTYNAKWDGLNNAGSKVTSGIYFYQLRANNTVLTNKMILLK